MSGQVDLGTLTVKLAADVEDLKKGLAAATRHTEDTNRSLKKMGEIAFGAFEGLGGSFNEAAAMSKKLSKGIQDIFGENATALGQSWGKEMQKSLGMTDAQVKGLSQAVKGLEGAFEVVGVATKMLLGPIGAATAAVVGLVAAWGAFKQLVGGDKGVSNIGKSFDVGWGALKVGMGGKASEPMKEAYWGDVGANGQTAMLDQYKALVSKLEKTGTLMGDEVDQLNRLQDHIPGRVLGAKGGSSESSVAGTLKETLWEPLKKSLGDGMKDIQPIIDELTKQLEKAFAPGKTKADKKADSDSAAKKFQDEVKQNTENERKNAEWMEEQRKQVAKMDQKEIDDEKQSRQDIFRAEEDRQRAELEHIRSMGAAIEDHDNAWISEMAEVKADMESRWAAVASGKLGTALGIKGMAGGILDMVGSAASGYQRTGAVLQGASTGLQSSGGNPWGAVIGAIVALLLQTKAVTAIFEGIEGILGSVVDLLDNLLDPLMRVLEPILDLIGSIIDLVSTGIGALNDLVLDQALGGSVGDKNSQWGKYSVSDWLTLSPLISEAGTALSDWINGLNESDKEFQDFKKTSWEDQASQMRSSNLAYNLMSDPNYQGTMEATYDASRQASERQSNLELGFAQRYESYNKVQLQANYLASALYELTSQTRTSSYELSLLGSAAGAAAYIDAAVKAAEVSAKKAQLDVLVQERLQSLGLAADNAATSVQKFSDAFLNLPSGYKLALSQFNATSSTGGFAGGGGGGSLSPAQSAGGGGGGGAGGGGGGQVNVTIVSNDAEAIWTKLQRLMQRDNFVRGGTPVARAAPRFG